eukprot:5547298-Pyramimonas_sp.AAC.1
MVLTRWLQRAGIHAPSDIRNALDEGGEPAPNAYAPFGNNQIRLLLRSTGFRACLTEEEAISTARLLIENLGTSISNATDPPGDAERVLRAGEPDPMPGWDAGEEPQTCTISTGDLNGAVE